MKTARIFLVLAAIAAFGVGPAFAEGASYVTHPGHPYGPSHNNYRGTATDYTNSPSSYGNGKSAATYGAIPNANASSTRGLTTSVPY